MTERELERAIVTVLFADIVGFTTLSDGLDAEDVVIIQERYFEVVRAVVGRHGGRLEKFIGDAACAVFGVPRLRDDDAERAVRAGLSLTNAVDALNATLDLPDGTLRIRVGVNTGEVAMNPEAGSDEAVVTGDAVNVAARFQTAAPPGGVMVGEATALAVAESIELEPAGSLELKGKPDPVLAWRAVAVLPERSRSRAMGDLRAPTLGRESEALTLAGVCHATRDGGSESWVIVAPPGTGKTRLADGVGEDGVTVLRARERADTVAPFDVVAHLLRVAAGSHDDVERRLDAALTDTGIGEARRGVVRDEVIKVLERVVAGAEATDRNARFAAWLQALDAMIPGPQVWIMEDVHWAGPDLLAFLDVALRPGRSVIATARPSILASHAAWVADASVKRRVLDLAPLRDTDARSLVHALIGNALAGSLVDRIVDASGGNPLFVEELLRSWAATGILTRDEDSWSLTASVDDVVIPTTVRAIYAAQLDELEASERAVARRGSVAGRRFPREALVRLDVPSPDEGLEGLLRRALVSGPEPDPVTGDAYTYRHALLHDAGYASLSKRERARLHLRFARWLEELGEARASESAEMIARQYDEALGSTPALSRDVGDGASRDEVAALAASWYQRAAATALGLGAQEAARALFERSLDLTPAEDALARSARLLGLGRSIAFAADMDEGAARLLEATEGYRTALLEGPEEQREAARDGYARAAEALGRVWQQQVRFHDQEALADRVLAEIGDEGVPAARMLMLRFQARQMISEALAAGSLGDLDVVLAAAHAAGNLELELEARYSRAAELDGIEEEEFEQLAALAQAIGDWDRLAAVARMRAFVRFPDEPRVAAALATNLRQVAEAGSNSEALAWADYVETEAAFELGDDATAMERGLRGIDIGIANSYHRVVVRTWYPVLAVAVRNGDAGTAARAARWFDEHASLFPDTPYAHVMHTSTDLLLAEAGIRQPFVPGLDHVRSGFEEWAQLPTYFDAVLRLTQAWLDDGDIPTARTALDILRTRGGGVSWSFSEAIITLLEARILRAEGVPASRVGEYAAKAERLFESVEAAPWAATARSLHSAPSGDRPL